MKFTVHFAKSKSLSRITNSSESVNPIFSTDGSILALVNNNGIQLWNGNFGTKVRKISGDFNDVDFSADDGNYLIAALIQTPGTRNSPFLC